MNNVCKVNQNITDKFKHLDDVQYQQEYLRNGDTLHSWEGFTIAALLPIFGWYFVLYSMYEAVRLFIKHRGDVK